MKKETAAYFTIKTMQYIPPNSWPEIFLLHKIQKYNILLRNELKNHEYYRQNPAHAIQALIDNHLQNLLLTHVSPHYLCPVKGHTKTLNQ